VFDNSDILLRWSVGSQDTTKLSEYEHNKFIDFIWLTKLSIISFQKWFPKAQCVLLYNGNEFKKFCDMFYQSDPKMQVNIEIINQYQKVISGEWKNPYHFYPKGVWWKWIPFRIDINKHEIAIDTDIICISKPITWYDWVTGDSNILVAPERYETVSISTTGDYCNHPLLKGKTPYNCGVVGQRKGQDYTDRFFEITQDVKFGHSHNSLFITEQGAINLWVRSLESEGVTHCCLDFTKNAWMRDFVYFLSKGISVETIHAVAWHKQIAKALREEIEKKVIDDTYTNEQFLADVVKRSSNLDQLSKALILKQVEGLLNSETLVQYS
jgi:hypothetical protein